MSGSFPKRLKESRKVTTLGYNFSNSLNLEAHASPSPRLLHRPHSVDVGLCRASVVWVLFLLAAERFYLQNALLLPFDRFFAGAAVPLDFVNQFGRTLETLARFCVPVEPFQCLAFPEQRQR